MSTPSPSPSPSPSPPPPPPIVLPIPPHDPEVQLPPAPDFPPTEDDVLRGAQYRRVVDASIRTYFPIVCHVIPL
jgi:hypothetical protein